MTLAYRPIGFLLRMASNNETNQSPQRVPTILFIYL